VRDFLFDENLPRRIRFAPSLPVTQVETKGKGSELSGIKLRGIWDESRAPTIPL